MNKAIVFGGSGFIGSHVIDALLNSNYEVINFDTVPYEIESEHYKNVVGSILDQAKVSDTIYREQPQVVYNFAAIADIDECQKKPLDTIRKNVYGNALVLQGLVDLAEGRKLEDLPKFVFASSLYVYSREGGFYASAKRACEMFIRDYSKFFGMPFVIVRYGTIYGPRAGRSNSMYRLVKQALDTGVISYYGTGEEVREYVHVKDVARCSVEILDEKFNNEAVVIAGSYPVKAYTMVRMLHDILGEEYEIEYRREKPLQHYTVTPYAFTPDLVVKKSLGDSYDLASGLLSVVHDVYNEITDKGIGYERNRR